MEFKLPEIGEGVHEGELIKWLVKNGDSVVADQPLLEVMTDKATVEVPAPAGGKISGISSQEGQMIKVGQVLATIDASASASVAAPTSGASPAPVKPATPPQQIAQSQHTSLGAVSAGASTYNPPASTTGAKPYSGTSLETLSP